MPRGLKNSIWGDSVPTVEERFWAKVEKTDTCWLWIGTINDKGYGQFTIGRESFRAHRFAYELLVGPIPEGLELDHLCRNRACVNSVHLEPVTTLENFRRGLSGQITRQRLLGITHCRQGHPYDLLNTYWNPRTRKRACRVCGRQRDKIRYYPGRGHRLAGAR